MERIISQSITARRPFQGVWNIIRFNWHFYVLFGAGLIVLLALALFTEGMYRTLLLLAVTAFAVGISVSLLTSLYVYDLSGIYTLDWLRLPVWDSEMMLTINAGFDEFSRTLQQKFPTARLRVFDFYNPAQHTEPSIERARAAYPAPAQTEHIETTRFPLNAHSVDTIFVIFSAHEIRDAGERILFFKELHRVLKSGGVIVVTEHLRDAANLCAYSIGAFHFFPRAAWLRVFQEAGLSIDTEFKLTPFVTTFILKKHGTSS
jgi:hypothetical protein